MNKHIGKFLLCIIVVFTSCEDSIHLDGQNSKSIASEQRSEQAPKGFFGELSQAAVSIIDPSIKYVPTYEVIPYPKGDVDPKTGVCTDVVIRTYRKLDIDLQQLVHEDMVKHFNQYPQKWGLKSPDRNIDHRRVPNLMTFFERKGKSLPLSNNKEDFLPGDIVTWNLANGMTHIGMVIHMKSNNGTPLIVHNIGGGQVAEDVLFSYTMTGHYRFQP